MKILICGDSFAVTDARYPGIHWSEKILNFSKDFEVMNFAYGGSSNALIALQLSQGLRFNPDFVIFTFTSDSRYEFDNDPGSIPSSMDYLEISNYLKNRYTTNMYEHSPQKNRDVIMCLETTFSKNFEKLKNYFYIMYCLNTVQNRNIKFCYSLGGFEYKQDYSALLNQNFLENDLANYRNRELLINLWYYQNKSSNAYFHVDDPEIQNLFYNQCMEFILGKDNG